MEAEGLSAALRSEAVRLPIVVDVATEGVGRYPKVLEATVYFCVLEALHNVVRHSGASSAQVSLQEKAGRLSFEVRDAGTGFDPETIATGRGIVNMVDRMDVAGGTLSIDAAPGTGTRIVGSIPIESVGR